VHNFKFNDKDHTINIKFVTHDNVSVKLFFYKGFLCFIVVIQDESARHSHLR